MAIWDRLRAALSSVEVEVTYSWNELDALVGGLPPSAYKYRGFWSGDRSGWPDFTTTDVRVHESVTFIRHGHAHTPDRRTIASKKPTSTPPVSHSPEPADLILIGCVKQKLDRAAPARDLYTSALFRKSRTYVETRGTPWFILSAEHGLVDPDAILAPYDRQLSKTPRDYRHEWGRRVVAQLEQEVVPLAEKIIEIHAGAAYVDAVRDELHAANVVVVEPLHGLPLGSRLSWYTERTINDRVPPSTSIPRAEHIVEYLNSRDNAITSSEFVATGRDSQRTPGLYSWWVDKDGADDLTVGLGHPVIHGLIYAGLAGATRPVSGRKSNNTLWGRIHGMHLGGKHELSTFRHTLGSILATARGEAEIDEAGLTYWMHQHLSVVTTPVDDGDLLQNLEDDVLSALDPPLNLAKVPTTALRAQLTHLRRHYARR